MYTIFTTGESDVILVSNVTRLSPNQSSTFISILLPFDGVSQEMDETFTLQIANVSSDCRNADETGVCGSDMEIANTLISGEIQDSDSKYI